MAYKSGRPTLRKTKMDGWYEFYREACPICGKVDQCVIHEDNNRVWCLRVASDIVWGKNSTMQGWLHFLNEDNRTFTASDFANADTGSHQEKKSDGHLNRVYRALLSEMELRPEHRAMLKKPDRDMNEEELRIRQYRSFPEKPYEVVRKVVERVGNVEDLIGVPGFYSKEGKYGRYFTISGFPSTIMIPFRNHKNEIVGFQWRVDEVKNQVVYSSRLDKELEAYVVKQPNLVIAKYKGIEVFKGSMELKEKKDIKLSDGRYVGTIKLDKGQRYMWFSSANKESGTGAGPLPIHVSVPSRVLKNWKVGQLLKTDTVVVTEGPIKSDKSAELLDQMLQTAEERLSYGTTVLSVPGVNSWRLLCPYFEEMGVKNINFAFDMDAEENPDVRRYYHDAINFFSEAGYNVSFFIWDRSYKGLDDLLIRNFLPIKYNIHGEQIVE
ncbi:DUF3854 domain-containing protein [Pseudobacillus sp. 179-B 2D1 NHS]|uniref:DUF3854 domain-containing protein n=1 Tax=Pseudobacillus sp. 179-B 2D1 NHS TaxID=3374292 RepID=UPI003879A04F